jgi:hypothetical protein
MISILRVRFDTNADPSTVWSDQQVENWMKPLIPFSLGDFWWTSSRGLYSLDHVLYPPLVVKDPRPGVAKDNATQRAALKDAVIKMATDTVKPDWDNTDILMIWFAQPTDTFGGGGSQVTLRDGTTKNIPVTVVDNLTAFDAACQELGHSYGLSHEIDADGREYASPYSVMSARSVPEFLRPSDARLPDGAIITATNETWIGSGANRIVGPSLAAAQLYREQPFRDSPSVMHLDGSYAQKPVTRRLYALNYKLRLPPGPLPVLLSFPSHAGDGRTFLVELRRGGVGYDQAVTPALVVHSLNPDGRVRYEGRAALTLANDHTDWPCTAGDFALRLVHVDPAHEFVDVMLHAGAQTWFPIRGVLLCGRFRTQRELNAMSNDDMRNTLIVELTKHSHQADYQRFDDDTLAGMGAVMVFLREGHLRDDAGLSTMTADDQRNTLIVELDGQTHVGRALQGFDNLDLVRIGLGSDLAIRGQVPGRVGSWIRGVLLLGGFRTHHELNGMSADDMRNTLIVELTKHSSQHDFQRFNDAELEGMGAVMVAMRRLGIRDDNTLRTMTTDDQRNTLIVELDGQTHLGRRLQGLQNIDLAKVTLGVVPA